MENDNRPLLLSLKPRYAELVFQGLKTAELRRRISRSAVNRHVFVYVSSPVQELRGGFRVEHVWTGSPESVWGQVSDFAQLDKGDFDAYYAERSIAYALKIADLWEYKRPVSLHSLRIRLNNFVVPQSWRYARLEEYKWLTQIRRAEHDFSDKRGRMTAIASGS